MYLSVLSAVVVPTFQFTCSNFTEVLIYLITSPQTYGGRAYSCTVRGRVGKGYGRLP